MKFSELITDEDFMNVLGPNLNKDALERILYLKGIFPRALSLVREQEDIMTYGGFGCALSLSDKILREKHGIALADMVSDAELVAQMDDDNDASSVDPVVNSTIETYKKTFAVFVLACGTKAYSGFAGGIGAITRVLERRYEEAVQ